MLLVTHGDCPGILCLGLERDSCVCKLVVFLYVLFNCFLFFVSTDSSTYTKEYTGKETSSMDVSQKGKAAANLASLREQRKSRASEDALNKKREVEAAQPERRG